MSLEAVAVITWRALGVGSMLMMATYATTAIMARMSQVMAIAVLSVALLLIGRSIHIQELVLKVTMLIYTILSIVAILRLIGIAVMLSVAPVVHIVRDGH
jgi:hypothetical protein